MSDIIYLDHNATTPISPAALARMVELQREAFGNPSSVHQAGKRAGEAVDEGRRQVAALVGARPSGVVFTAGGTEADVAAIWDVVARARQAGRIAVVVCAAADHHAILHTAAHFESLGLAERRVVPVDPRGHMDLGALERALDGADLLCTLWANNETGTLADHHAIAARLAEGQRWHCDAVQAAGKVPIDLDAAPHARIDSLALSAHKLHGPKGVGALVLRGAGEPFVPLLPGGAQERGRRSGTLNAPGIAAFGVAAQEASVRLQRDSADAIAALRDRLEAALLALAPGSCVNGDTDRRLPNTLHLSLAMGGRWLDGEDLLLAASRHGIAVATGAACASGSRTPSHVLIAMGRTPAQAHASLRLSLGHQTTAAEIDRVVEVLGAAMRGGVSPSGS